jgi:saccharopine dehydrogenase-like NADP-dependent oxidoreductase
MKIVVLGVGMVGSAIAKDLAQEQGMSVKVVDRTQKAL